jgi:hypothetical protein
MNNRIDAYRNSNDGVMIPRIWVMIALSILMHLLALWELPSMTIQLPKVGEAADPSPALTLRLAPPVPLLSPVPAQPAPRAQRPEAALRPQPAPPVIALNKPTPDKATPAPAAPPPPRAAAEGDMDSYIEARRRARGATTPTPTPPVEDDEARSRRIIAGNLPSQRDRTFGYDPRQGGGMFQIEQMSVDYAEFIFYGRNNDINRNTKQLVVVRRDGNSNIQIAVVRKMIALIRENTQEDFLWVSQRLGRSVTLSARARDNAGLEEFMMRDFFPDAIPAQR